MTKKAIAKCQKLIKKFSKELNKAQELGGTLDFNPFEDKDSADVPWWLSNLEENIFDYVDTSYSNAEELGCVIKACLTIAYNKGREKKFFPAGAR